MRTTCIRHPEKEELVIFRKWQVEFCEGNVVAAALLNIFEYWHSIKISMNEKNLEANNIAEKYGDKRTQDETLYQFHTYEDLQEQLMGMASKNTIVKAKKLLIKKGAISVHKNPNKKYAFDKTMYFLFYPEKINDWINTREVLPKVKIDPRKIKIDRAITEITSEISENTSNIKLPPFLEGEISNLRNILENNIELNNKIVESFLYGEDFVKLIPPIPNSATPLSPRQIISTAMVTSIGTFLTSEKLDLLKRLWWFARNRFKDSQFAATKSRLMAINFAVDMFGEEWYKETVLQSDTWHKFKDELDNDGRDL